MSVPAFFQKITITSTNFADSRNPNCVIRFDTSGLMLYNETDTAIVEVSFDGVNVHDELNPAFGSQGMVYDNRSVSVIWFRLKTGTSATIAVRAW